MPSSPGQDLEFFMQGVYEVASQNNVSIYPVDPRGLPVFEFDIDQPVNPTTDSQFLAATQNTLRALAVETDGRAILNRNDLDVGMKQIIRDSSAYYLIGYTSQAKSDGKFHAISVKVKRPGVQVRSRKGYWALTPPAAEAVTAAAAKKLAPPTAVDAALNYARHLGSAEERAVGTHLDRHDARSEREDEGHVRLGADAEGAGRPAGVGQAINRRACW